MSRPDVELEFESGLTLLRVPSPRSPIVHRLTCARLARTDGPAYWIDARNAAATHVLYDCAPSRRTLRPLRIARAVTAYQHRSLVREVTRRADAAASLVVATNVASLYADDDLPDWERADLLAASLSTLRGLGRALEVPVLATTASGGRADGDRIERPNGHAGGSAGPGDGNAASVEDATSGAPTTGEPVAGAREDDRDPLAAAADRVIECVRTREGVRLEGEGVETVGYRGRGYWQTTIPYWVERRGAVEAFDPDWAVDGGSVDAPWQVDPSVVDPAAGDPTASAAARVPAAGWR